MTDDSELMAAVVDELEGRTSKEDAITSGELSERLGLDDGEANPEARELVRDAMEEHDLPVVSCHAGYWLADSPEEVENYIQNLDSRIAGIQERKRRLVAAYNRRRYNA